MADNDLPLTDRVMLAALSGQTNREKVFALLAPDIPAADADRRRQLHEAIDALVEKNLLSIKDDTLVLPDVPPDDRFTIEAAVRDSLPPLSEGERAGLTRMLLRSPVPPTLVVWQHDGHNVLADGHLTSEVCRRFGRPTQLVALDLPDLAAVIEWRWDSHYARRNLSKEAQSYCRGWQYQRSRGSRGGDRRAKSQNETSNDQRDPVAIALANKFAVSRATIFRDRDYAEALDAVAAVVGDDVRQEILARRLKQFRLTRADVLALAEWDEEELRAAAEKLRKGERVQIQPAAEQPIKSIRLAGSPAEQAQILVKSLGQENATRLAAELSKLVKVKVGK